MTQMSLKNGDLFKSLMCEKYQESKFGPEKGCEGP